VFAQRRPLPTTTATRDIGTRTSVDADRRLRQLRSLEVKKTTVAIDDPNAEIPPIYRKSTKEESTALDPPKETVEKYSEFLKKPRTGIVTLNADERCGTDGDVVSAEESCLRFQFPGGGVAYSFRVGSYRIPRLADLKLAKDILITDSVGQQGILVDLGERPIEELGLKSAGLHFLAAFKPAGSMEELRQSSHEFEVGVSKDGYLYRLALFAKANHTFGLRSIAYDGRLPRSINGVVYDEFTFDKRQDVTIVFTIADIAQNGNVTIVWRELRREDSFELRNAK
jgi:hypothetical protein